MLLSLLVAAGTALVMPLTLCLLRRFGVVDEPSTRSSHAVTTLRGGGAAPATVAVTATLALGPATAAMVAVASGGFALIGFVDDLRSTSPRTRLAAQIVVGAVAVVLATPEPARWLMPAVLFWVVGYVNAFNFMDGINGISGLQAIVVGSAWMAVGSLGDGLAMVLGGVLAGAALGFLPWNFPRAKVFPGDVGSYFFGAWIAVSVVVLTPRLGVVAAVVPTMLYPVDTAWTLARRLRRGDSLMAPHREHAYQRLVQAGWSHTASALAAAAWSVGFATLGVLAAARPGPASIGATVAGVVFLAGSWLALPALVQPGGHA